MAGGNEWTSQAFHADGRPSDRPEVATDAWSFGLGWFDRYVRA